MVGARADRWREFGRNRDLEGFYATSTLDRDKYYYLRHCRDLGTVHREYKYSVHGWEFGRSVQVSKSRNLVMSNC